MAYPMGEAKSEPLWVDFDRHLNLEYHGSDISSDGGLLSEPKLDDALGLILWVTRFYNGRGAAEQFSKDGKTVIDWTRFSCHNFRNNSVRLLLHALAYNLSKSLPTLALPEGGEDWSLTTLGA